MKPNLSELERAFARARSRDFAALGNLIRRLRGEGYSAASLLDLWLELMKSTRHAPSSGNASKSNPTDRLHLPLDEAKEHIKKGDVPQWLKQKFNLPIDTDRASAKEIAKGLQNLLGVRERKKFLVARNGICLLIASTNSDSDFDYSSLYPSVGWVGG